MAVLPEPEVPGGEQARVLSGMANVAALTFLVARAVPLGWTVGVAAGVPLARAAERHGARAGYAAATASLVETVAIMGPARMGIPVPHAASAPLLGVLERRHASFLMLAAAGAAVRTAYYVATSAFSIVVLIGLDAYLGSYERLRDALGFLPTGRAPALWLTLAGLIVWSILAGVIQAWVVRRGLRRWAIAATVEDAGPSRPTPGAAPGRRGAGALVGGAVVGFAATLASTGPWALGAIALVLAAAWALTAADGRTFVRGLGLAAPLALSTFGFGAFGGIGASLAGRRAACVALLVMIAVWVRSAAGSDGLRDVSVRLVHRLRRVPVLAATGAVLGASVSASDFGGAARRLASRLRTARRRPTPILDASLGWLADESTRLAAPQADADDGPSGAT